jgi:hypothetical protein
MLLVVSSLVESAAAGVERSLRGMDVNPTTEKRLQYTHESFVEKLAAGGAHVLVGFVLGVVQRTARCFSRTVPDHRAARGVAQVAAATYSAISTTLRWLHAMFRNITFNSNVTVPFMADVDYRTIPVEYSRTGMEVKMDEWAKDHKGRLERLLSEMRGFGIITMNNIGIYRGRQVRVWGWSGGCWSPRTPSSTSCTWRVTRRSQGCSKITPKALRTISRGTASHPNAMEVERVPRVGEVFAEQRFLDDERLNFASEQLTHELAHCTKQPDGSYLDEVVTAATVNPLPDPRNRALHRLTLQNGALRVRHGARGTRSALSAGLSCPRRRWRCRWWQLRLALWLRPT